MLYIRLYKFHIYVRYYILMIYKSKYQHFTKKKNFHSRYRFSLFKFGN